MLKSHRLPSSEAAPVAQFDPRRLRDLLSPTPDGGGSVVEIDGMADGCPAAVLVPIVLRPDGPTLLLTRRTEHLRDHPGQISFPGGRVEPADASPLATALREAAEEIGLDPALPEPLGYLPEYRTGTGFRVMPVVAFLRPPFTVTPHPGEVAEVFEVPLAFLLDPANHQRHSRHYRGALRHFHALPYGPYFIWGATAGMIVSLYRLLLGEAPEKRS
jgi:8-oxo-dGTP pyrophosphatase MutT (NUDIX family)